MGSNYAKTETLSALTESAQTLRHHGKQEISSTGKRARSSEEGDGQHAK